MAMLHKLAYILVWAGGLNWGLVGLFNFNLVDSLVGGFGLTNIVYVLVGVSTIYTIYLHMMTNECRICKPGK